MKIAIVQSNLSWEEPETNRATFLKKINEIEEEVDLIILPEMFTSGFTMNPISVAESMDGETVFWLKSIAKKRNCAIVGSVVITENENYFNRCLFVFPSGEVNTYNKRHLFTLAGEDRKYKAGKSKTIVYFRGFKICPLICYDLRFPVFSRNAEEYDLLLYVANWPEIRINAWDILLRARSVENQCFTIGVNRVGTDQNQLTYNGHSQAVDYLGNYLLEPQEEEGIFIITLDKNEMLQAREKLDFLSDRDSFTLSE
ncbi:MAG: nitrilase family protein [Flavobacterium sp.]|nr:nitrilase family protein [Flavobacterium sp.]